MSSVLVTDKEKYKSRGSILVLGLYLKLGLELGLGLRLELGL